MIVFAELWLPGEPPVAVWSAREIAERSARERLGEDFFARLPGALRAVVVEVPFDPVDRATLERVERAGDKLVNAIHGLDSYAALGGAPMERTQRAEAAVDEWREVVEALRGLLAEGEESREPCDCDRGLKTPHNCWHCTTTAGGGS